MPGENDGGAANVNTAADMTLGMKVWARVERTERSAQRLSGLERDGGVIEHPDSFPSAVLTARWRLDRE